MRSILVKTSVAMAIVAIAAFGADSSAGTWKLNLTKSKYGKGPVPVKSLTVTREAADGATKVTLTGERANGDKIDSSYVTQYDGSASPVTGTGSPFDSISVKRESANKFVDERQKIGGKYHAKGTTVVADHGKILKATFEGTDTDGKKMKATYIYEKQ
jgi:hypothetical protein